MKGCSRKYVTTYITPYERPVPPHSAFHIPDLIRIPTPEHVKVRNGMTTNRYR